MRKSKNYFSFSKILRSTFICVPITAQLDHCLFFFFWSVTFEGKKTAPETLRYSPVFMSLFEHDPSMLVWKWPRCYQIYGSNYFPSHFNSSGQLLQRSSLNRPQSSYFSSYKNSTSKQHKESRWGPLAFTAAHKTVSNAAPSSDYILQNWSQHLHSAYINNLLGSYEAWVGDCMGTNILQGLWLRKTPGERLPAMTPQTTSGRIRLILIFLSYF